MSYIEEKEILYIHSDQAQSGTSSNFTYSLPFKPNIYDSIVVLQMNIPKSYYLVRAGLNTFTLNEINQSATITIPVGNYSRTNFKTTVQSLLNSSSPNRWTYSVTTPPSTGGDNGKYTYTVSGNGGVQPQIICTVNVYQALGFAQNSTNTFVGNSLTSTNVINMQATTSIFLYSDIIGSDQGGVLQEAYGTEDTDFSNITYQCQDVEAYTKPLASNSNNVYSFTLMDEMNNVIDLNGQSICVTLMIYKKQNVFNLLKNVLKLGLLQ